MKICPVCSETFGDDLKFCELDGTRLARQAEATGAPAHQRSWSMLGIGLLVGALALSAVSVFVIPRSRPLLPSSSPASSPTQPATSKPPESTSSSTAAGAASGDQPEIVIAENPPDPTARKKEKGKATAADGDGTAPKLDPKAAAQTGDDTAKLEPPSTQPAAAPKKTEPAPTPKAASEAHDPDTTPKAAATPDVKKDTKHTKDAASDSDKKRADDKDKKKGGFFRVFKKIFGKD